MKTRNKNGQTRLGRNTLTRESIVDAALRILDESGESKLTFTLLGRELGASPSAMYRHFSSRDEILDAIGDELIRISLEGYAPHDRWEDSLWDLAERAWRTYADHPAAATETYFRVTRGPNELRAVDAILQAVGAAGLSGEEAVMHYHVFAMTVLAQSADYAAKLAALNRQGPDNDGDWEQVYIPKDPADYPHYWAVREVLRHRDERRVFRKQVDLIIQSVRRTAEESAAVTP